MNEAKPLDLEEIRKKLDEKIFEVDQVIDWKIEPKGDLSEEEVREILKRDVKIFSRVDYAIEWRDAEELLEEIKQRIKAACEFYLRYKDKPELLIKNHYPLLKSMEKKDKWAFLLLFAIPQKIKIKNTDAYNKWIFKLAFKDVFKEEEK